MNLTSDVFYGLLKLTSGEEIIAKVCSFIENEEVLIVLDNPIIVSMSLHPHRAIPLVKVQPWISLSDETIYIIRRDKVITMTEIKDESLVKLHKNYESKLNSVNNNQFDFEPVMNIEKARKSFEELYSSKDISRTQD